VEGRAKSLEAQQFATVGGKRYGKVEKLRESGRE